MKRMLWLGLCLLPLSGCGQSQNAASTCTVGQSIACAGENGCTGHQVCRADGSGYDGCICGQGPGDPTDGGGLSSNGPHSGLLGAECDTDSDCRKGMVCLASSSTKIHGEGPGNGMCVVDCTGDDAACKAVDPASTCVPTDANVRGSAAYCYSNCTLGNATGGAEKCRNRGDLACTEQVAGSGAGYCRPACQNDSECGARHCNLSTGLCTDVAPTGAPVGAACAPTVTCAGGCLEHNANFSECSGACTLGAVGCGENRDQGPPYAAYCLIEPRGAGLGDLGYCAKVCDCDAECARADMVCSPTEPSTQRDTGRKGVCSSRIFADGSARPNLPCAN